MSRIKEFYIKYLSWINAYWLVTIVFLIVNSKKLNDLHTDKEGLERFAREEYFMKRSNEDVFIIKDK